MFVIHLYSVTALSQVEVTIPHISFFVYSSQISFLSSFYSECVCQQSRAMRGSFVKSHLLLEFPGQNAPHPYKMVQHIFTARACGKVLFSYCLCVCVCVCACVSVCLLTTKVKILCKTPDFPCYVDLHYLPGYKC